MRFQRVIKFLLHLLSDGVKLVDEVHAIIEIKVASFLAPRARLERAHALTATASLQIVQKLWIALVNLDEIGLLIHYPNNFFVLLLVLHVERLY